MFASKTVLLFWMTFLTPLIISYSMKLIYKDRIAKDEIYSINVFHEVLTIIQTILMIYVTFVPFYSYTVACWDKIGIWMHLVAIHVIFVLIPLIAIVHSAINFSNYSDSRVVGWLFVYAMINVMTIIYYFAMILKLCRGMIQFQRVRKAQIADEQANNEDEKTNYFNIWRGYGEGPIRIGTQIPIGNNLYSLLYIACLQQEAIEGWK